MIDMDMHVIEPPSLFVGMGFAPLAEPIAKENYLNFLQSEQNSHALLFPTKVLYPDEWEVKQAIRYWKWIHEDFPEDQFIKILPINLKWSDRELLDTLEIFRPTPTLVCAKPLLDPNPGALAVLNELRVPLILHPVGGVEKYSKELVADHVLHGTLEGMRCWADWICKGYFETFNQMRFLFMETGSWWVGPLITRMIEHKIRESAFGSDRVFFGINVSQYSLDTTFKIGQFQYVMGSDFPHYDGQSFDSVIPPIRQMLDSNARRFLGWEAVSPTP